MNCSPTSGCRRPPTASAPKTSGRTVIDGLPGPRHRRGRAASRSGLRARARGDGLQHEWHERRVPGRAPLRHEPVAAEPDGPVLRLRRTGSDDACRYSEHGEPVHRRRHQQHRAPLRPCRSASTPPPVRAPAAGDWACPASSVEVCGHREHRIPFLHDEPIPAGTGLGAESFRDFVNSRVGDIVPQIGHPVDRSRALAFVAAGGVRRLGQLHRQQRSGRRLRHLVVRIDRLEAVGDFNMARSCGPGADRESHRASVRLPSRTVRASTPSPISTSAASRRGRPRPASSGWPATSTPTGGRNCCWWEAPG